MIKNFLMVGLGGMIGSMMRYAVYVCSMPLSFPYATLAVNLSGSFLIGLITGFASRSVEFTSWRLFLATGICGGFTTFSAFSMECVSLLQQSRNIAALTYVVISVLFGVAAAFGGYLITR